jgi:hypothetical protein
MFPEHTPLMVNVLDKGADPTGIADNTAAIQTAVAALPSTGGTVFFPAGTYKIASAVALSSANIRLVGAGKASTIQPSAAFSGTSIVTITAANCSIQDLTIAFANTSYASNPAVDGIQITGAANALLQNVGINYINGWAVQSTATAGVRNKWAKFDNVFSTLCAKGMHIAGIAANNNAAHVIASCILDQVATGSSNGDGLCIEDCYDIEVTNLECNISAGSGNAIHIKGRTSSIHIANVVCGGDGSSTSGAGILIESGANGTPSQIEITNAIVETANDGMDVSAGTELAFFGCRFETNQFNGIYLSGGDTILIEGCSFNNNNQHGGANRFDFVSGTSGNIIVSHCMFLTASGSGVGQTTAAVNVTAGHVSCKDNVFLGTPFSSLPQVIRGNAGYNPVGVLGPPSVPSSTVACPNPYNVDCTVYVTGGTVTVIAVGGSTTGLTSGAFRVPAGSSITLTYSVSPTWTWFGD